MSRYQTLAVSAAALASALLFAPPQAEAQCCGGCRCYAGGGAPCCCGPARCGYGGCGPGYCGPGYGGTAYVSLFAGRRCCSPCGPCGGSPYFGSPGRSCCAAPSCGMSCAPMCTVACAPSCGPVCGSGCGPTYGNCYAPAYAMAGPAGCGSCSMTPESAPPTFQPSTRNRLDAPSGPSSSGPSSGPTGGPTEGAPKKPDPPARTQPAAEEPQGALDSASGIDAAQSDRPAPSSRFAYRQSVSAGFHTRVAAIAPDERKGLRRSAPAPSSTRIDPDRELVRSDGIADF